MKPKDRVIHATDRIAETFGVLARINFDNEAQMYHNASVARRLLRDAGKMLSGMAHHQTRGPGMKEPDTFAITVTIRISDWREVDIGEYRDVRRHIIRAMLDAADKVADIEDVGILSKWDTAND